MSLSEQEFRVKSDEALDEARHALLPLADSEGFEVLGSGVVTVVDAEDSTVVHAAGDSDPITLFGVRLHLLPAGCLFDFASRTPSIGPAHDKY